MRAVDLKLYLFAAALLLAALLPLRAWHAASTALPQARQPASVEWAEPQWVPQHGSIRRLDLSPLEQRFARQFPGHIGRFTDGRDEWIVRVMDQPTRMLHPAADCFQGMGYTVSAPRVRLDRRGESWRCFKATRNGRTLQVCERIFDAQSGRWTDASSWYWAALLGAARQGSGPWWAVTHVEAVE